MWRPKINKMYLLKSYAHAQQNIVQLQCILNNYTTLINFILKEQTTKTAATFVLFLVWLHNRIMRQLTIVFAVHLLHWKLLQYNTPNCIFYNTYIQDFSVDRIQDDFRCRPKFDGPCYFERQKQQSTKTALINKKPYTDYDFDIKM